MMPSAALGISPAMHDRIKLEEEHRARLAREEEREREIQREKERELREQREKEQREREREQREREREQREKELREKEQKEKEARERKIREEERERERERERQQLLNATHHYSNQLYSPLNRNLLGSMMPHINLGLRGPPAGLHSLAGMSHYHAAAANAQRQSPMGLNLGMPGMPSLPGHGPSNLQHHLQQAAMGLAAHPAAAGLTHPGFSAAAALGLGPHPHSLNLNHSHLSPHHPVHQIPPHTVASSSAGPSPGAANSTAATSSSPHSSLNLTVATSSMAQTTSTPTPSSHIPTMSHFYHHGHLAAMHAAAAAASGLTPVAAHQQPMNVAGHPTSPKITPPLGSASNGGGSRTASSPHAMRHHIAAAVAAAAQQQQQQQQQQSTLLEKCGGSATTPVTHEPATLDLTGSNSNSSNQAQSIVSNSNSAAHDLNGIESNGPTESKEATPQTAVKDDVLQSGTPPVVLDKKPATPNAGPNQEKPLLPDSSPENTSRRSASPPNSDNNNSSNTNVNTNTNNSNPGPVGATSVATRGNNNLELCTKITSAYTTPEGKEEQSEQSELPPSQRTKVSSETSACVAGGSTVTSTTSGSNSPPVVSSSTNGNSSTVVTAAHTDEVTTTATPIAEAS